MTTFTKSYISALFVIIASVSLIFFAQGEKVKREKHQVMLTSEYARVIDNVNRSMAGKDGVITDDEKVGFLRFLGITQPIQSGQVLRIAAHHANDRTMVYDENFLFDIVLGQEVQQGRGGQYITPAKVLGTFPKSKLEEFANVNVKWIE